MMPGLAGAADLDLPAASQGRRARDLVDDHAGRADLRARSSAATSPTTIRGRGSSCINVPVGLFCAVVCWQGLKHPRDADAQAARSTTSASPAGDLGRRAADHARHRQGSRLVRFAADRVVAIVAVVGFVAFVIWELSEKHPIVDLSPVQAVATSLVGTLAFCLGYAVFFGSHRAAAAVAADAGRLHRHLGRPGRGAERRGGGADLTARRQVHRSIRRALFASDRVRRFRGVLLHARRLHRGRELLGLRVPLLVQGIGMAMFFIAMLTILLDGVPPRAHARGLGLSNFMRITAGASRLRSSRRSGTATRRCTRAGSPKPAASTTFRCNVRSTRCTGWDSAICSRSACWRARWPVRPTSSPRSTSSGSAAGCAS